MKKYIYSILFFSIVLSSCQDILDEQSQDLITPKTVQDYSELLYGEAYMKENVETADYIDIMSDDVTTTDAGWSGNVTTPFYGYYTWQADPEINLANARSEDNTWKWHYHSILACNLVIKNVPNAKGSQEEKNKVIAEAKFLRAWNYFTLVNVYGLPYKKTSAASDLGVPINDLTILEDKKFDRTTVLENYKLIDSDLTSAISLFQNLGSTNNFFRANLKAAYLLASRVALYKKEYTNAINYANLGIAQSPTLYNLNGHNSSNTKFINAKNPEILFSYGEAFLNSRYSSFAEYSFVASTELLNLYESTDLRRGAFFDGDNFPINKTDEFHNERGAFTFAMRTAELYLNRAEAYVENNEIAKGIADINFLRNARFSVASPINATTKAQALPLVRKERRIELAFEKHRWFDLRRWEQPAITHIYKNQVTGNSEKYTLKLNDAAYTMPVPASVLLLNPKLKHITRPERNPN